MNDLDPIPEENLVWDYYYKLYYNDDDGFVPPENQNYIYTTPMAEGGYDIMDPTTEKDPLIPDTGDDDDDDDTDWDNTDLNQIPAPDDPLPDDTDSTQPFDPPRAASTPAGEQIPMVTRTKFPQEEQGPRIAETNFGGGDSQDRELTPLEKKVGHKLTKIENEAGRQLTRKEQMAFEEVRDDFKQADLTKMDARYSHAPKAGDVRGGGGQIIEVKFRNKDKWYRLKTQSAGDTDKTLNQSIPPNLKRILGEPSKDAVDEEIDKTNAALQDLQKQEETQRKALQEAEKQVAEAQRLHREMDALRARTKDATERIQQLEDTQGPLDKDAIQKLKDEKRKLEADHQAKRKQLDRAVKAFQQARKLQQDINKTIISKGKTERRLGQLKGQKDAIQPLEELKQKAAELNEHITEDLRIIEDENTSPSEREAARERFAVRNEELERLNEEIEVRERQRPLLERVKEIFKKYGWTLQAVVLAVGITISAVVLATLNGLKAATKAIGNGLKNIGKQAPTPCPASSARS